MKCPKCNGKLWIEDVQLSSGKIEENLVDIVCIGGHRITVTKKDYIDNYVHNFEQRESEDG